MNGLIEQRGTFDNGSESGGYNINITLPVKYAKDSFNITAIARKSNSSTQAVNGLINGVEKNLDKIILTWYRGGSNDRTRYVEWSTKGE